MKEVFNSVTNRNDIQFTGKLLNVNEEIRTNSNGTNFMLGTIEFVNAKGETKRATCGIYEKNYNKGMVVGEEYLCTASSDDSGKWYIHVSHLQQVASASAEDFGQAIASSTARVSTVESEVTA